MDVTLVIKGAIVGFVVATPAGPIAMLCIHRTLDEGRLSGIATGLGAALADTALGALAALGVTFVTDVIASDQVYLRLAGGLVLCVLGAAAFVRRPKIGTIVEDHLSLLRSFASAFALTIVNPLTIVAFLAIFTGLGLGGITAHRLDAMTLILGVFAGAAAFWMLLAVGTALFRDRFTDKGLLWMTRGSGIVILTFGLVGLASGISRL